MNKKIIGLVIVIIIAIVGIGAYFLMSEDNNVVSDIGNNGSSNNTDVCGKNGFNNAEEVSVGGEKFFIPEGYELIQSDNNTDDGKFSVVYVNTSDSNSYIGIGVSHKLSTDSLFNSTDLLFIALRDDPQIESSSPVNVKFGNYSGVKYESMPQVISTEDGEKRDYISTSFLFENNGKGIVIVIRSYFNVDDYFSKIIG